MTSLGVMAEEMDKDRKKAFELQGKLDKFKKGPTAKGKRVYVPDACEAAEKRVAKLEELYDTAIIDVQVKFIPYAGSIHVICLYLSKCPPPPPPPTPHQERPAKLREN